MKQKFFTRALRTARALIGRPDAEPVYLSREFPGRNIGSHSYGSLVLHVFSSKHQLLIGDYCSFGSGVEIFLGGEHRTDWISTYPFNVLYSEFSYITGHPHSKGDVVIGNDVWLGRGAAVLSGVKIGNGAVVGAYSVVARDVPDYAIVAGNPAKVLRMRFAPEVVARLQDIQWWNWPHERVRRAVPYLQSSRIDQFLQLVDDGQL